MPSLTLYLMMSLAGYAVFVFVSECFNPFRIHRSTALQKRQVVGVLSGVMIALSPMILHVWPAANLANKIIHSLIAASIGIAALILITGIATLIELFSNNKPKALAGRKSSPIHSEDAQNSTNSIDESRSLKSDLQPTQTNPNQQQKVIAAIEEIATNENESGKVFQSSVELPVVEPIETLATEHGDDMKFQKQKNETLSTVVDSNHDLDAALDEAEAEMRQVTANEKPVTNRAAELKEAKPILEPANHDDSPNSEHVSEMDTHDDNQTDNANQPLSSIPNSSTKPSLLNQVERMKSELKATDASLQKVDELITEHNRQSEALNRAKQSRIVEQSATIAEQQDQLISESITAVEAQNLISLQQDEITRARSYGQKLEQLILEHQSQLSNHRKDLEKSREMARRAAVLARQAADAHQKAKTVADQERQVRLQVEDKAHKAVKLAENAISALAKEEQKNASRSPQE